MVFPVLTSTALASLEMDVTADDFYLSPGTYTLTIRTDESGYYGLTSLGKHRSWVFFRGVNFYVTGEKDINFTISPPERAKAGTYRFPIMVYSLEDDSYYYIEEYKLIIEDKTEARIAGLAADKDSFLPGEKITANATVKNTGTSDLDELVLYVKFTGSGFEEEREKRFSLDVGEEKSILETFDTSLRMNPGTYEISLTLMKGGQKMDSKKRLVDIERVENVEEKKEASWRLVYESGTFYLRNVGNIESTERIEMEIAKPWDWFAFFSEMPQIIDNGGSVVYVWEVTLGRDESREIGYEIHYWPFIIIAIVILYALYLVMKQVKSPTIRKHSIQTRVLEDDKREVIVAVEVKTGGKKMEDVLIEDRVPSMAHLIKDFKTIKPVIKQTDEGTIMRWRMKNLDKRENIILTYKFRTMIGAVGYFRLPKAVLKAKVNKVMAEYFSNSLRIKEE